MEYRGLRIAKDILFNTFWIGYAFLVVSWLLFMAAKPFWTDMLVAKWQLTNPELLEVITIGFFALAKFVLFFYVLVPALAIHWTLRKLARQSLHTK